MWRAFGSSCLGPRLWCDGPWWRPVSAVGPGLGPGPWTWTWMARAQPPA